MNTKIHHFREACVSLLLLALFSVPASSDTAPETDTLDRQKIEFIVQRVADEYEHQHFDKDVGRKISTELTGALKKGKYRKITSAKALAEQLTADIFTITHDLHAGVRLNSTSEPVLNPIFRKSGADLYRGADFERIDRLKGNIGYVKIQFFTLPEYFNKKSDAVMHILADTDALIIDLRDAYGGDLNSVAYFCSFFINQNKPSHLLTTHYRSRQSTELWTSEVSEHYSSNPIYILTSKSTFSGAEAFVYNLKALGRATIVGEKTAGGANGGFTQPIGNNLGVMIPAAETISTLTNSNWENSGITPHLVVTKEQAMNVAVADYLSKITSNNANVSWDKTLKAVQKDVEINGESALFLRYAEKP